VRGQAGEKRFGSLFAKKMREAVCGRKRGEAESRKKQWMTREQVQRLKDFGRKRAPMRCEWLKEATPASAIAAENRLSVAEVALEGDGGAIVKRMREGRRRVNPLEAMFLQWQRRKKWRARSERVDRGTKIMEVAWKREIESARRASRLRLGFENVDVRAALRKDNGRGQAVGSRTDDAGFANHGLARRQFIAIVKSAGFGQELRNRFRRHAV
jgi:hypothetical protein